MNRPKMHMSVELQKRCQLAIHHGAVAAAAGAAVRQGADFFPVNAAQLSMVRGLAEAFGVQLPKVLAQAVVDAALSHCPEWTVFLRSASPETAHAPSASSFAASAACSATETIGWMIAEEFLLLVKGRELKVLSALPEGSRTTLHEMFYHRISLS